MNLGHYASETIHNPLKGKLTRKCQVLELIDSQTLRIRRSKAIEAALSVILPSPQRFKHVWHLARENKVLYAWKPIPPEGYVSLGLVFSSSDSAPDISSVRCVPKEWCVETDFIPIKVWDDSGAGGGKPGSIWVINSFGHVTVCNDYGKPTEHFYDLKDSKIYIDSQSLLKRSNS